MAPLKQFVSDSYFFSNILYFVLINICKLEYYYCCVVAILISFDFISFVFAQESIFAYNLYLHLISMIRMLVNLSQYQEYQGTVGTFNNQYLVHFRNSYQHLKYYLNNIDIAFGVISFSCTILTTISIFFLSLIFGVFVCNTIKIFLFSRFRKLKGVFISIFVFTFFLFFHESYF